MLYVSLRGYIARKLNVLPKVSSENQPIEEQSQGGSCFVAIDCNGITDRDSLGLLRSVRDISSVAEWCTKSTASSVGRCAGVADPNHRNCTQPSMITGNFPDKSESGTLDYS